MFCFFKFGNTGLSRIAWSSVTTGLIFKYSLVEFSVQFGDTELDGGFVFLLGYKAIMSVSVSVPVSVSVSVCVCACVCGRLIDGCVIHPQWDSVRTLPYCVFV